MVYRVFVEKRAELAEEAESLCAELRNFLGLSNLAGVRLLNRYDAEGLTADVFEQAVRTVFSEPQLDVVYSEQPDGGDACFAVEYLPGQFDQRADSAAQCIQLMAGGERPVIRSARVYILTGNLTAEDVAAVKRFVINPVEAREASQEKPATLAIRCALPTEVEKLVGFCSLNDDGLAAFIKERGLAMDLDDIRFCRDYFRGENREPTITEIRMIDTYWSDHCRHTTFLTTIDKVEFEDPYLAAAWDSYEETRRRLGRTKPKNLMDIATLAGKYLHAAGKLEKLDESEEINACTVKITVRHDGKDEDWLLLFKNETHNHPTEIEPFGGAATCIGGAIRDPLSGRSYVYAAMRVTGAADPTRSVSETIPGKLPQRRIVQTAAAGYSSYGNQIGLATGMVDELYHPGYAAKRMEIGAVIAATPAENVRRVCPAPGDSVILLGGRTGRDGIGGATGSSKAHTAHSVETCGAEVQKGNAPEERKLQRLFRNGEACRLIKRCNDFGAGGVSVAIGELADGLEIDLNAVPRKYDGLDGTELAISESQERMAVVVDPQDTARFLELAASENLEATVVAHVTENPRLVMNWNGHRVVDLSRDFLNSNGAEKHTSIAPETPKEYTRDIPADFADGCLALVNDLNVCSRRGLSERFDSTIGAGTVLMPFGGKEQKTPIQAMVQKVSVEHGDTDTCSFMAWGYNPYLSERSPFHGAYLAVVESVTKLIATGASFEDVYLTFQEYFEKPGQDPRRWGQPLAALLGAFRAQMDLGIAAIGGKDSMSGSFESLDVPPTLVSFAVTTGQVSDVVTNDMKAAGHKLVKLSPNVGPDGLPVTDSLLAVWDRATSLMRDGKVFAAYTPTFGGIVEAVYKMCIGNGFGFAFADALTLSDLFGFSAGTLLLEVSDSTQVPDACFIGNVTDDGCMTWHGEAVAFDRLNALYEGRLESVFPMHADSTASVPETISAPGRAPAAPAVACARPRVLIPVFPGTNCEYDSARAVCEAGAEADIFIVNNLTADSIAASVETFAAKLKQSNIVFLPGGFSGGDEPDGSGKFIMAFLRNAAIREEVGDLLDNRNGLMCGICNGFQALIKLGLVPFGRITDTDVSCPTLTYNRIGRHQSKLVRIRVASNTSPWLAETRVGDIYTVPVSHGEGRFLASDSVLNSLLANGQIATQYVDADGHATMDIQYNPNGSAWAIEGITSPDGRVIGKMGHTERVGKGLYRNVPGETDMKMFAAAVGYLKKSC
jgi:phosphoribosylformylglycinamidine synthase